MKKIMMMLLTAMLCAGAFSQWYSYDDKGDKGTSTIKLEEGSDGSATMSGAVTTAFKYGYCGMGKAIDVAAYQTATGIRIVVKGDGKLYNVRVETSDRKDYCYHEFTFKADSKVTTFEIPYSKLFQEEWGKQMKFDPSKITAISFQTIGQPITSYSLTVYKIEPMK